MEAQIHEPFIELQPDPIAFIDRLLRLELKPREWGRPVDYHDLWSLLDLSCDKPLF